MRQSTPTPSDCTGLAVKREYMVWRCDSELDIQQLLTAAMDPQELARFNQVWQGKRAG
ncbi:IucC [Klebsiella pneumoniae]|uniref:IucC n=1 Tax=Klebsiella pneumoniae TaxID=573 RepID=A0A377XGS1_KLEPN|nr:IucC [Klebsiella pneumoniae]